MTTLRTKFAAKAAKSLRRRMTDAEHKLWYHLRNRNFYAVRDAVLAEHGYAVLRFWNNDVLANIDGVLTTLALHLERAPSPGLCFTKPDLSPKGEVKAGLPPS